MSKPFNFEEFMAGVTVRTVHAKVYLVDKTDEIEALNEQADDAALKSVVGGDNRMTSKSAAGKIKKQIEALQAEMEDGAVEFEFRPLTPDEFNELQAKGAKDEDYDTRYDQLAAQSVNPKLTADQWREFANSGRVTIGQFIQICSVATNVSMETVSVPKASPNILEAMKAKTTSGS